MTTTDTIFPDSIHGPARSKGWDYTCVSLTPIRWLRTVIDWLLPMNTSFEFQGSTQHTPSRAHTQTHSARTPARSSLPPNSFNSFFFFSFHPSLAFCLCFSDSLPSLSFPFPRLPLRSAHATSSRWWIWWASQGEAVRQWCKDKCPLPPPVSRFSCLRWCGGTGWLKEG